ncbi:MAG: hypothetical protein NVSMB62_28270 [Acidobacteriaceae bacterium]
MTRNRAYTNYRTLPGGVLSRDWNPQGLAISMTLSTTRLAS